MKNLITICLITVSLLFLTSCSCAIYREEFTPLKGRGILTEKAVQQVAASSGFSQRSKEQGQSRFENDDVELLYDSSADVIIIRSSLCPFFSVPFDPQGWHSDCENLTNEVVRGFDTSRIPLRKLSLQERINQHKPNKAVEATPLRSVPHLERSGVSGRPQ